MKLQEQVYNATSTQMPTAQQARTALIFKK